MATTTVRLDPDEERALDELALAYGGRSNALREGLRLLATGTRQRALLVDLMSEWEAEAGPVDEGSIDAVVSRYGL